MTKFSSFPGKQTLRSPSRKLIELCSQEHTDRCGESVGGRTEQREMLGCDAVSEVAQLILEGLWSWDGPLRQGDWVFISSRWSVIGYRLSWECCNYSQHRPVTKEGHREPSAANTPGSWGNQ